MLILSNYKEFKNRFKVGKKWLRCAEAIDNIPHIKPAQCHSIGDSLVYLLDEGSLPKEPRFIGHRRYMDLYYIIEGSCTVEYAPKTALQPAEAYADESDREYFEGAGESHTLKQGSITIFEPGDAHRILSSEHCRKLILRVTVEDNTFLNK